MPKPRNPFAFHPLLRKGGVHQRCRSGERAIRRADLTQALDEWFLESEDQGTETIGDRTGGETRRGDCSSGSGVLDLSGVVTVHGLNEKIFCRGLPWIKHGLNNQGSNRPQKLSQIDLVISPHIKVTPISVYNLR